MTARNEQGRLRPNLRPFWLAIVANVLFGGLLLGVPYVRGKMRAEEATQSFARFSACLFRAEIASAPGLILPRGERTRFASLAMSGGDWPERCQDELDGIAHDEAILLFPSVKSAENEVRAAVAQLSRELASIEEGGRVPERPLSAFAQLQAALSELVRAGSADVDARRDAIVIAEGDDLPAPSIVPIRIASGGEWSVGLVDGAILVSAMDRRGIGHVRVADGGVELKLARHGALVSGLLGARSPPWVIWSTPAAQCGANCAQRATGLAAFIEDGQTLSRPVVWLRAHPMGEPREAVHVGEHAAFVAAIVDDGLLDARRFAIPESGEGEPPQIIADLTRLIEVREARVHWMAGEPPVLAWANGESAGLWVASGDREPVAVESPGGTVRIASAGTTSDGWIVFASERGLRVRRADGSGETLTVDAAIRPPERGALGALCRSADGCAQLEVWTLADGAIRSMTCEAGACGAVREVVPSGAARFDVARLRDEVFVAWTTDASNGPVRITRIDRAGEKSTTSIAACWDPARGLCGEPQLASDTERLVVVTREGADLRVLESEDGRRWRALAGLEQP